GGCRSLPAACGNRHGAELDHALDLPFWCVRVARRHPRRPQRQYGTARLDGLLMIPQEIIRRKRDGEVLQQQEIAAFIDALAKEKISEGQAAAFAMAVFFRGMSRDETVALTLAMRDSGTVLEWTGV